MKVKMFASVCRNLYNLSNAPKPANPFTPKTTDQILSDLEVSRQQIKEGKGLEAKDALKEMGRQHGFI